MFDAFPITRLIIDTFGAWLYCCIVAVVIIPLILDRILFYIPMLAYHSQKGEVAGRGIIITVLETLLWIAVPTIVYLGLYIFDYDYFVTTTSSPIALSAWIIGVGFLVYRIINYNRVIKRRFYYKVYMRYITPGAYEKYASFVNELDNKSLLELNGLIEQPELPYMYLQSALRKQRETRMVELLSSQNTEHASD